MVAAFDPFWLVTGAAVVLFLAHVAHR